MPQSLFPRGIDSIAGRIVRANSNMAIRPATPADEPFLRALFDDVHAAEFAGMGLPEATLAIMVDLQFRAQQSGYRQTYPQAKYLVIERAGAPIGRLTLAPGASGGGRTLHIVDIAILAAARGQGIGAETIARLEGAAREMGATELTQSVLFTNGRARQLYERLGFAATHVGVHIAMVKRLA